MGSIAGHFYIKIIIEKIFSLDLDQYRHLSKLKYVLNTTGPRLLTNLYNILTEEEKKDIYIIPTKYVTPFTVKQARLFVNGYRGEELKKCLKEAYAVHYFLGTWLADEEEDL
ncbi:MAG: hypothetical protein LUG96_13830 [Tannerellaceae bacterium]|nr:hypothetical protein [Tannerellaceae bacterium]MCD7916225.1 hypothetical protein [Tannerellaceae bacterium]